MSKKAADPLLAALESSVLKILEDDKAKLVDRLKATELGAKLLLVKHKIDGGSDAGSFFGPSK